MTTDISTNFLGLRCPNGFFLASAPPTEGYPKIVAAYKAGWGGVVTKTISVDKIINVKGPKTIFIRLDPQTGRFTTKGKGPVIASWNWESISDKPLSWWLPHIRKIKSEFPSQILVASIMAGSGESELKKWQELTTACIEAGADAIEMNVSCPHMHLAGMGSTLGEDPTLVEESVRAVKEASKKANSRKPAPVLIKLVSSTSNIAVEARAAVRGGADGITSSNTFSALPWFDADSKDIDPIIHVNGKVASGGLGGPVILPLSLQKMRQLSQADFPNIGLSGVGGISKFKDALSYFMLGCGTVQVATAAMIDHGYGPNVIKELVKDLTEFLDSSDEFHSVADLVGARINRVVPHDQIERPPSRLAEQVGEQLGIRG